MIAQETCKHFDPAIFAAFLVQEQRFMELKSASNSPKQSFVTEKRTDKAFRIAKSYLLKG